MLDNNDLMTDFESWSQTINDMFCPMEVNSADDELQGFKAELTSTSLNRIQLARIASGAVDVYRRTKHIAKVSDSYYLIKFQLQGKALVQQCGREAYLSPGDFTVCSTTDPYELHFPERYRQAVLAVPQKTMKEMYSHTDNFLGVRMGVENPTHGLLSQFVMNLVGRIDEIEPTIVQRLEANILDLLVTSLHAASATSQSPVQSTPQDHLQAVKRLIGMHLRSSSLSPEFIAAKEGISKRYLHMLFKSEGISVSRFILQQRLKACHRAMALPNLAHLSTTDIAIEWGFSDVSHFHRCFKAHYDLTPRHYRMQALHSKS